MTLTIVRSSGDAFETLREADVTETSERRMFQDAALVARRAARLFPGLTMPDAVFANEWNLSQSGSV
jgi:hypothetical protein